MVVDTGTSILAGPPAAMNKIPASIGNVTADCSNAHTLPTITISMGGKDFELGPSRDPTPPSERRRWLGKQAVGQMSHGRSSGLPRLVLAPAHSARRSRDRGPSEPARRVRPASSTDV